MPRIMNHPVRTKQKQKTILQKQIKVISLYFVYIKETTEKKAKEYTVSILKREIKFYYPEIRG